MLPHRDVYCADAGLVYAMVCLALSMLRLEGNNTQKVFTKCYHLLVGWMHPCYGEGDPELRSPPSAGCILPCEAGTTGFEKLVLKA